VADPVLYVRVPEAVHAHIKAVCAERSVEITAAVAHFIKLGLEDGSFAKAAASAPSVATDLAGAFSVWLVSKYGWGKSSAKTTASVIRRAYREIGATGQHVSVGTVESWVDRTATSRAATKWKAKTLDRWFEFCSQQGLRPELLAWTKEAGIHAPKRVRRKRASEPETLAASPATVE